jgi:hypothetical protein
VDAKLPPGCLELRYCDWSELGARALLGRAFKFVTALLRRRVRGTTDQSIADATGARLRELGRDAVAATFSSALADNGNDGAIEGDGNEEALEGRLLALKLRECSLSAE